MPINHRSENEKVYRRDSCIWLFTFFVIDSFSDDARYESGACMGKLVAVLCMLHGHEHVPEALITPVHGAVDTSRPIAGV